MEIDKCWFQFLEKHSVEDALQAVAYDAATPQQRQCLKTAIAFHALRGESPQNTTQFTDYGAQGFWQEQKKYTAPWLVAVCTADFASPARLMAALMPAIMQRVPVFFVFIGDPTASLLLTLELLGVENVYKLKTHDALLGALQNSKDTALHRGRFLFLQHKKQAHAPLIGLQKTADSLHIPIFVDHTPPLVHIHKDLPQAHKDLVYFAHADAHFVEDATLFAHACFTHKNFSPMHLYQHEWLLGMEACWLYANYGSHFYYNISYSSGLTHIEL